MITLIAAAAENNALGKDNQLVWHLPDDFKRFKALTTGHYIIMGRKTFESFPKPLPNRTHVIITRQTDYAYENCIVVHSLEAAIAFALLFDHIHLLAIHVHTQMDISYHIATTRTYYSQLQVYLYLNFHSLLGETVL